MFWYDIEPGCFGCFHLMSFHFKCKRNFAWNSFIHWVEQNKLISIISSLLHYTSVCLSVSIIQKSIKLFGNKLLLLVKLIGKFDRAGLFAFVFFYFAWAIKPIKSIERVFDFNSALNRCKCFFLFFFYFIFF